MINECKYKETSNIKNLFHSIKQNKFIKFKTLFNKYKYHNQTYNYDNPSKNIKPIMTFI